MACDEMLLPYDVLVDVLLCLAFDESYCSTTSLASYERLKERARTFALVFRLPSQHLRHARRRWFEKVGGWEDPRIAVVAEESGLLDLPWKRYRCPFGGYKDITTDIPRFVFTEAEAMRLIPPRPSPCWNVRLEQLDMCLCDAIRTRDMRCVRTLVEGGARHIPMPDDEELDAGEWGREEECATSVAFDVQDVAILRYLWSNLPGMTMEVLVARRVGAMLDECTPRWSSSCSMSAITSGHTAASNSAISATILCCS